MAAAAPGQADVFGELPFGTDVRGRGVKVPMAYHNWLIGSIPRQGKTASVRVLACGAALPARRAVASRAEGIRRPRPARVGLHRFISGIHDESIAYAAERLKLLRAEVERRTARLKALDRGLCPDKRVTREIASQARPEAVADRCACSTRRRTCSGTTSTASRPARTRSSSSRSAPAFGVILVLATQRPDKESLPTGVSGNVDRGSA